MAQCNGTTHYRGCDCHELRRDTEQELLKAQLSTVQAERDKLLERVDEESQNYVNMMELRDVEIRKNAKLRKALERAGNELRAIGLAGHGVDAGTKRFAMGAYQYVVKALASEQGKGDEG